MNWGVEACKLLASVNDSQALHFLSTDLVCWALWVLAMKANTRQIEELYPDGRTPWRYPNSGGLVGPLQAKGMLWAVGTCLRISSING